MSDLVNQIVSTIEQHADYDIPDEGFERDEFVIWIMNGVGEDLVRDGNDPDEVEAAAREAYDLVSDRFRLKDE
jgi:hypothetical protein